MKKGRLEDKLENIDLEPLWIDSRTNNSIPLENKSFK
jgi:hypothetical protein